jgi:hypothetical protein
MASHARPNRTKSRLRAINSAAVKGRLIEKMDLDMV